MPAQFGDEPPQSLFAAELGIDSRRIDHVVAVHRARPRRHDRRGIEMTDAERGKVRHQGCGIGEGKAAMELQPHRRARHAHAPSSPRQRLEPPR